MIGLTENQFIDDIFLFSTFVRSPNPLAESTFSQVTWPQFTEDKQAIIVLDMKPRVEYGYKADKVTFWIEVFPKLVQEGKKDVEETEGKTSKDEL